MSGELLKSGQKINTSSGLQCTVGRYLGGGGQGEVYECKWGDRVVALKWYYPSSATKEQYKSLNEIISERSPNDNFLWPESIAEAAGVPGFGYLMKLRDPKYRGLAEFMAGKLEVSALSLINFAMQLVGAMRDLHLNGQCYGDINFGNAFIEPESGQILICDNDNVTVNRTGWSGVAGTPRFMAPEIMAGGTPSTTSDQHSLAVLLFYIFCMAHPLEGRRMKEIACLDLAAHEQIYGSRALFIFDPDNDANSALEKAYDPTGESGGTAIAFWRIYPEVLKQTFIRAFTIGLRNPGARPTERDWLDTLSLFRDSLFRCTCGSPNYYDPIVVNEKLQDPKACWSCGRTPQLPMRIRIGRRIILLNHDTKLYPHHVSDKEFDYSTPMAEVSRHPTNPNIWGLKNCGQTPWNAIFQDGVTTAIPPGRSAPLANGVTLDFGKVSGVLRV